MKTIHRRRGTALLYASVFLVAVLSFVSFAVDWGRVQTAKQEMRNAVDAAARYAAAGLNDNTCLAKAQSAAAQNSVDGSTLTLLAADVETGTWDTVNLTFVPNGTPKNTVCVTGVRTAARGNPVPLIFGRIVGATSADVTYKSVVRQSSLAAVGVDSLTFTGSALLRRKSSEGGGVTAASNGAYTMSGASSIGGDALYRATAPTGVVSGKLTPLPADFAYATPVSPVGPSYSSISIVSGNNPVSGSVYCTGDVYVGGTAIVTLYGDTNIYIGGNTTFTGSCTVVTNGYRLYLYSTGTGSVAFSSSAALTLGIYAPAGAVTLSGPGGITGSVVGKTLSIGCTLDYTATLPIPAKATGGDEVMAGGGMLIVK